MKSNRGVVARQGVAVFVGETSKNIMLLLAKLLMTHKVAHASTRLFLSLMHLT